MLIGLKLLIVLLHALVFQDRILSFPEERGLGLNPSGGLIRG